jgi:hypothetical protein
MHNYCISDHKTKNACAIRQVKREIQTSNALLCRLTYIARRIQCGLDTLLNLLFKSIFGALI